MNATWGFEELLEATPSNSSCTVTYLLSHKPYVGDEQTCRRIKDELIIDVFSWTPTPGHICVGRPARIYINQICADTRCSLADVSRAVNDRNGWCICVRVCVCVCVCVRVRERERKRERGASVLSAQLDDDNIRIHPTPPYDQDVTQGQF